MDDNHDMMMMTQILFFCEDLTHFLYFQKCAHKMEEETGDLKAECGYFYGYSIYKCSCTITDLFLLI